jgi:hypothetical protein
MIMCIAQFHGQTPFARPRWGLDEAPGHTPAPYPVQPQPHLGVEHRFPRRCSFRHFNRIATRPCSIINWHGYCLSLGYLYTVILKLAYSYGTVSPPTVPPVLFKLIAEDPQAAAGWIDPSHERLRSITSVGSASCSQSLNRVNGAAILLAQVLETVDWMDPMRHMSEAEAAESKDSGRVLHFGL